MGNETIIPRESGTAIEILADDANVIAYRPRLVRLVGSVTAAILLQQILYRWNANGRREFYKYKEPCSAADYYPGDSWTEELGFSRREFDTAIKKLQDLGFVVATVDRERRTFYRVEVETLGKGVSALYLTAECAVSSRRNAPLDTYSESEIKEKENRELSPLLPDVTDEAYPGEERVLELLRNQSNHDFEPKADRDYLRTLTRPDRFPDLDPVGVVTDYVNWLEADKSRRGSRTRILRFFTNSRTYGNNRKTSSQKSTEVANRLKDLI